ncbi:MAG: GHKL domain-containing protein [Sphingobacteriales bacterium]|nr:MAG: GHKL domain-containing protein [Sphingobacteriales bacterium]
MLNNLQFLIQSDGDKALKLLAQYSKVLRYYIYESQHKTILLNDEVSFLKTYLELEKDRLKDEAKMEIAISIAPNEVKIAPFVLSTFVENCFKHLSMKDKWIAVLIHFKNNDLYMNVKNTYDPKIDETVNHQGIGLEQVKKRLELTYPGKHTLTFEINEHIFSIELGIQFD